MKKMFLILGLICAVAVGCNNSNTNVPATNAEAPRYGFENENALLNFTTKYIERVQNQNVGDVSGETVVVTLDWSEYPSWSAFGVAHDRGLVNGEKGKQSDIEKKWNVDIVLVQADYDTCITHFSTGTSDAACLTNLDTLAPSLGRPAVAVLPTSTSDGADALIVVGNTDLDSLKGQDVRGLEKSVSQYVFERNLVLQGKNPQDYVFKSMDPAAAAQAMQTNQPDVNAIVVWNPFVLQTLRLRQDSKVLFDSTTLKEEVIDCVMFGKDFLDKKGGDRAACCVIEVYYAINKVIDSPETRDDALVALGSRFSSLGLEDMKVVCQQTRFYNTPEKAIELFNSAKFRNETSKLVFDFCVEHDIVPAQ